MTTPTHPTDVSGATAAGLFKVTGTWNALVDPYLAGSWSFPETIHVQGLVTFTPRIPAGSICYQDSKAALALAPRYARIWDGQLANINVTDSRDVYLQANTSALNLLDSAGLTELVYDVVFSKVSFGGKPTTWQTTPDGVPAPTITVSGVQKITSFAFVAPTDPREPVCLTDPGLKRLAWQKPLGPQAPVG